jgi:type IV secretion system protein VirB9
MNLHQPIETLVPGEAEIIPGVPRAPLPPRAPRIPSQLRLTTSGQQRLIWRGVGALWHRLFALSVAGVVALALAGPQARGAATPRAGIKDARVRNIDYDPDQVVTVTGHFRHAVEVEFGAGETVVQAALGDTISWQIAPVGNVLFLKPRERARPTNLIVITSMNGENRTYHFNLIMGAGPAMYGIRFRYPRQLAASSDSSARQADYARVKAMESAIVAQALDHAVIEGARNLAYTEEGDSDLQPTEISDNGEFTVLRYPGHADIPSIFGVDVDGSETIVPYDVRDDFVVIHAVYRELRLRRGNTVLCIYNEAPARNDRAVRTGTVSNIIDRRVRGQ